MTMVHAAKPKVLNWEVLAHAVYSRDLASSDYHLFVSMGNAFAEKRYIAIL